MASANTFGAWDYVVFSLVVVISTGIGLFYAFTGGKQQTTTEFLLADRNMRLIPISLSILVSFMSAIAFLGTPAEMYTAGTEYWLLPVGLCLANLMAGVLFIPLLHPLELTSSYEYLERRFRHRAVKLVGSIIMMIQQMLYMGVTSYAPSTALEAVTGFPDWATIIIVCLGATIYTTLGGMRAVVWTDAFQAVIMIAGFLAVLIEGIILVGGFGEVWRLNEEWDRIKFPSFDPDPTIRHTFWCLIVGGSVKSLATYGISQASVQRYSALTTVRRAQLSLVINSVGLILMYSLACIAGIVIFAYYVQKGCDPLYSKEVKNSNQIVPLFVMEVLGYPGVPGLFVACLFSGALSTMSSCLNAAATVSWTDFLKPFFGHLPMRYQTLITKGLVAGFGLFAIAMSFMARSLGGTLIQAAASFTGSSSGPLLGLFVLGSFFPWANWKGAVVGGILGLAIPMWINIGAYTLDVESHNLPTPTDTCPVINSTAASESPSEITGISKMYTLSYMWLSSVGVATCVIVGLVVSFATGPLNPADVESKYLIPFFDRVFCCLPERFLAKMRCGKVDEKDEEVDDLQKPPISLKRSQVAPLNEETGLSRSEPRNADFHGNGTLTPVVETNFSEGFGDKMQLNEDQASVNERP